MKSQTRLLLCGSLLLSLVGCGSPKSQTLATLPEIEDQRVDAQSDPEIPAQKFEWITEDGGQSQLDFNPKIDILFVTDNSDSMKSAQENLKRNINKFTAGIVQNKMIDYHIGVVSTWDSSERAQKMKKDAYQIGDLRHTKDSRGTSYKERYLTRRTATPEVLASSIHIGVTPYDQGGPEFEEFFSPIVSALEKNGPGATNEGFFRDDAQLVVIIMSDADDSSNRISPEQMARYLIDFKKGQAHKVSVYGVLVKSSDKDEFKDWDLRVHPKYHPECFETDRSGRKQNNGKCSGFGPERLEQFILEANSNAGTPDQIRKKFIMGITSPNFGSDLSRIGSDITVKTLEKVIYLQQRPRYENGIQVLVWYGSPEDLKEGRAQSIPEGEKGWLYNPEDNSLHLSGHIQYKYVEGGRFAVELKPLTLKK